MGNRREVHGQPRLIDACGEPWLAHVVQSNRLATVAEFAEVNDGSARKQLEYKVHHSLLHIGMHSGSLDRVLMLLHFSFYVY